MQAETTIYFVVWWVLFEYSFDHFPYYRLVIRFRANKANIFLKYNCFNTVLKITSTVTEFLVTNFAPTTKLLGHSAVFVIIEVAKITAKISFGDLFYFIADV